METLCSHAACAHAWIPLDILPSTVSVPAPAVYPAHINVDMPMYAQTGGIQPPV